MNNYKIKFNDTLAHYGVKGMKWGVWNEETQARYRGKAQELKTIIKRKSGSRSSKTLKEARRKDIDKMSTKEIKEYNDRLRAEREYSDLTKGELAEGKKWVKNAITTIATAVVTGIGIEAGRRFVKKTFGL